MARYYVEKDGEWNIFSTVVDDFLFDEFICLDALKARLLYERFKELTEDIDSLLTDNPRVNVMTYSEAVERKQADTPQTDKVVCPNCGRSDYIRSFEKDFGIKNSEYRYKCINCNTYIKDTPQTDFWSSVTREDWLKAHGLDADTPQPDCNGCEHWKYIAKEWQCETVKCQKTSQPDCPWK